MLTILAASLANSDDMLSLVIRLLIIGTIFSLIWYGIGAAGLPEPFRKVASVVVLVAAVIWLIRLLQQVGGF